MCLEDEKCDAFEFKTEVRPGVSSCLLIELQNAITMGYSYNVQHTGSVGKIEPVFNNLNKTVF